MALPKQRHTHHRRDRARKMLEMKPVQTVTCDKCGSEKTAHRVCTVCGTYRGREVVKKTEALKKTKKTA